MQNFERSVNRIVASDKAFTFAAPEGAYTIEILAYNYNAVKDVLTLDLVLHPDRLYFRKSYFFSRKDGGDNTIALNEAASVLEAALDRKGIRIINNKVLDSALGCYFHADIKNNQSNGRVYSNFDKESIRKCTDEDIEALRKDDGGDLLDEDFNFDDDDAA